MAESSPAGGTRTSLQVALLALVAAAFLAGMIPAGLVLERWVGRELEDGVRADLALAPRLLADRHAPFGDMMMMHAKEPANAPAPVRRSLAGNGRSDSDVLNATARAISRVGPPGLTLADVVREAGIAAPTLIQRFGSKRGLLLAFAKQAPEGVREVFAAARAEFDSPIVAKTEALVRITGEIRTRESMANHLAFLQISPAPRCPPPWTASSNESRISPRSSCRTR